MQSLNEFLDDLIEVARPEILTVLKPDSCIGSTRIGIDVLTYFGIKAIPVPVRIFVLNAEANRILEETGSYEELAKAVAVPTKDDEGGPWTMGIGAPDTIPRPDGEDPNKWAGHLVIGLPEQSVIVDLSMDQASRPHKGLDLKCMWYDIDSRWWDLPDSEQRLSLPGGGVAGVQHLDDESYRKSPNWKGKATGHNGRPLQAVTGRIITALKAKGWKPERA